MTAYLGPAGNLVAFKCPSDEQITREDSVSLSRTLGGVQKAQYGRRAPRAWQVGIGSATPAELGQLLGLMQGLYGPPPWTYVGPWAQVTNLLTPASSMTLPGAWNGAAEPSGALTLIDGGRPAISITNVAKQDIRFPYVPVIPGVPVTGSVWATGDPSYTVRLDFHDAAGALITAPSRSISAGLGPTRGSHTFIPPANATQVGLRISGALRLAQPAVTWTPDLADWSIGGGAPKVVARGLSQAVQMAVREERYLRRSSASFVLEEVGNA